MWLFIILVEDMAVLKMAVSPLLHISQRADMKCTPDTLSFIVSHPSNSFTVSLQMRSKFFASFLRLPDAHHYLTRIYLDFFFRNIFSLSQEDGNSMAVYLKEDQPLIPLKFENSGTGYLQWSALMLLPPRNVDVPETDFQIFAAINALQFSRTLMFLNFDDTISVTLRQSQMKFSAGDEEIVLRSERRECVVGGVAEGSQIEFVMKLNPMMFFIQASTLTKMVWFFKANDSCYLLNFPIGGFASLLVSFPQTSPAVAATASTSS